MTVLFTGHLIGSGQQKILTGGTELEGQDKKKQTGTFVVHVQHCENATWQGEVTWADKNRKRQFRSALELIRLMDDALHMEE